MKVLQLLALLMMMSLSAEAASLPGDYFPLLEAGADKVKKEFDSRPDVDLKALERDSDWKHFPYAILAPAVLYAKNHSGNRKYHDRSMLELALKIGDLLASENEKGLYEPRLDSDWDTGLWLEAYRILKSDLGAEREQRWRKAILENVSLVVKNASERVDFPWYHSPFIGTSPNHYALWSALLTMAGRTFGNAEWESLGTRVMRRYALTEQTTDGYWGEHNRSGPTTGYNHLTFTALAIYAEVTQDPDVMPALRRATEFHQNFTYPNGIPVEVINDRNRHWDVDAWGHFGFSNFPEGRRFAEFLTGFFTREKLSMSSLGRLAQDALYYHEGPSQPIPQDRERYSHQMSIPAGIRKNGPWTVCLSGIISTQAVNNQFYLDRQGNVSVFHEKAGLIITGANSKRQPELATFSEIFSGLTFHLPVSSRLQMSDAGDRLSLAYNTFFSDLFVSLKSDEEMNLRFAVTGKGRPPDSARLALQLCLKAGATLETASGRRITLGQERVELQSNELGAWIRHGVWTMKLPSSAQLVWPIYPHNPYTNGPETQLQYAVGALSVPLELKSRPDVYVRPNEQEISFTVSVP